MSSLLGDAGVKLQVKYSFVLCCDGHKSRQSSFVAVFVASFEGRSDSGRCEVSSKVGISANLSSWIAASVSSNGVICTIDSVRSSRWDVCCCMVSDSESLLRELSHLSSPPPWVPSWSIEMLSESIRKSD